MPSLKQIVGKKVDKTNLRLRSVSNRQNLMFIQIDGKVIQLPLELSKWPDQMWA